MNSEFQVSVGVNYIKIIFLDVDGVLNGYNKWTYFLIDISKILHIPVRIMRKLLHVFSVKEKYIRRLSKIVRKTGARIVMSSSWRYGYWYTPYEEMHKDQKKLYDLLHKYKLDVIDITPSDKNGIRENEINQWLNETELNIDRFVILDDESYDLQSFIGKELVKTSCVLDGNMIQGLAYEDTGLKRKHVKQTIKILNSKGRII